MTHRKQGEVTNSSGDSGSGNLMDEFEASFQTCLLSLTKPDTSAYAAQREDIELDVQRTTNRFIELARQMEAFFVQKRFIASTLKPQMLIRDENQDLNIEIQRKDALLNKHYSRLEEWKAALNDIQSVQNRPMGATGPMPANVPSIRPRNVPGVMAPNVLIQPGPINTSQQLIYQAQQMQQLRMLGKLPPK